MGDEHESHCSPTDVDVGVMVLTFRVLADATHGVDAIEKRRKLLGPLQCAVGVLPAIESWQRGIHFLVR